jgi:hypothetical protein
MPTFAGAGIEINSFGSWIRAVFAKMHNCILIPLNILLDSTIPETKLQAAAFLGETIGINALVAGVQTIRDALYVPAEALLAEILFTAGKFWYYKFLLNPTNVRFAHQKLQATEESSDITIVNTYRDQALNMSFTGVSGCTLPRGWMKALNVVAPGTSTGLPINEPLSRYQKFSAAWLKFRQLERFYREINGDLAILYDMDLYVGKFVNLNYSQDANNPWVINYDMQFIVYPGLQIHTMTPSDYSEFFDSLRERYGRTFVKNFEGKTV